MWTRHVNQLLATSLSPSTQYAGVPLKAVGRASLRSDLVTCVPVLSDLGSSPRELYVQCSLGSNIVLVVSERIGSLSWTVATTRKRRSRADRSERSDKVPQRNKAFSSFTITLRLWSLSNVQKLDIAPDCRRNGVLLLQFNILDGSWRPPGAQDPGCDPGNLRYWHVHPHLHALNKGNQVCQQCG